MGHQNGAGKNRRGSRKRVGHKIQGKYTGLLRNTDSSTGRSNRRATCKRPSGLYKPELARGSHKLASKLEALQALALLARFALEFEGQGLRQLASAEARC